MIWREPRAISSTVGLHFIALVRLQLLATFSSLALKHRSRWVEKAVLDGMSWRKHSKMTEGGDGRFQSRVDGAMIIAAQSLLLWSSLYVLASSIYVLVKVTLDGCTFTSTLLMIISGCVSISYIVLHNTCSYISTRATSGSSEKLHVRLRRLSRFFICVCVAIWLVTCGLEVMFTLARHPFCVSPSIAYIRDINSGTTCYIQRSGVGVSLFALATSSVLLVLTSKMQEPFTYSIFGVIKQQPVLPLVLLHKASIIRPMFSEMSFKCRSSTSLSSEMLVPSFSDSVTTLLPTKGDNNGLGIDVAKSSAPSFLAPQSSLSSIRLNTEKIPPERPFLPLPPVPIYCSERSQGKSAMYTAVHPKPRSARYHRSRKERTLRVVPPSPSLSTANLAALNQSQASLSSIYSQSISGKRYSVCPDEQLGALQQCNKYCNSNRGPTVAKSPPSILGTSDFTSTIGKVGGRASQVEEGSDSDIDDAATLQAKLPAVRAVSAFGDVKSWCCGSESAAKYYQRLIRPENLGCKMQLNLQPLMMRKTRTAVAI